MGGVHVQWANESTLLYQCQHLLGYTLPTETEGMTRQDSNNYV